MNATIRDVAREAQVSVATVSRALNGHGNVADPVRTRVFEAAARLRYSPHAAARSLSSRRTHTLGVVLPDVHGEFFSELVRGIDQVIRQHGLHLLVSSSHGHPDEQAAALRAMRGRVDGLVVMAPFAGVDVPSMLAASIGSGLPAVLLGADAEGEAMASLRIDNRRGAGAMVEHLAARGFRRIAFLAGPEGNLDAAERLQGFRDALARIAPGQAPMVIAGDFDEASGHAAGQTIASMAERPDAVFAANDMMALGCIFALAQAGLRVPGDIAVAGFDDIPLARYVHPGLTTMRVDIAELGARAARRLVAALAGRSAPEAEDSPIQPTLVERESTRRAPP